MKINDVFILEHLEKKSNAILGFIVLQSIFLGDKLASEEFIQKVKGIKFFYTYLFIAHTSILLGAIVFLLMIDYRVSRHLDEDYKKAMQPHFTLAVKIMVAVIFGVIPIFVFIQRLHH